MQSDPKMFESDDKPLDSKQQDYVNWINAQLKNPDLLIKNLTGDLRSGVRLLQLLEVFHLGEISLKFHRLCLKQVVLVNIIQIQSICGNVCRTYLLCYVFLLHKHVILMSLVLQEVIEISTKFLSLKTL